MLNGSFNSLKINLKWKDLLQSLLGPKYHCGANVRAQSILTLTKHFEERISLCDDKCKGCNSVSLGGHNLIGVPVTTHLTTGYTISSNF